MKACNFLSNNLIIFGYGLAERSFSIIPQNDKNNKISKIVFGDSHMVILYGKIK